MIQATIAVFLSILLGTSARAAAPTEAETWSPTVNGLQMRIRLEQKPKRHGVRWLVPYLELRNTSGVGNPMKVQADSKHLKLELVTADGQPAKTGGFGVRSGPDPHLGTIEMPYDSLISASLEATSWGITKDAPAMISTDWGGWTLSEEQNGKVYIRATLSVKKTRSEGFNWYGEVKPPLVEVTWK